MTAQLVLYVWVADTGASISELEQQVVRPHVSLTPARANLSDRVIAVTQDDEELGHMRPLAAWRLRGGISASFRGGDKKTRTALSVGDPLEIDLSLYGVNDLWQRRRHGWATVSLEELGLEPLPPEPNPYHN